MKPNEAGKKLLTESGWNVFYPKIRETIFSKIDARQPASLYDAEQAAFSALNDLRNHPGLNSIKDYTVEVSEFPLDILFLAASWVIRDDYALARGLKSAFAK